MADPQLTAALSNPAVASLSDADALVAVTTPAYTFRDAADPKYRIDATQVGYILGATKAAIIRAGLLQASANADPSIAAAAGYVLDILRGSGFSPSNADAQVMAQQFVAMKIISADDAKLLLNNVTYPAGRSNVTLDEVTAARAEMADAAAVQAREQRIIAAYNAAMALSQSGETDLSKIQAAFDTTLAGA